MTVVGIIGGQLQGFEASYLAKEAGFKVVLVDKDPQVPAKTLADEFYNLDLLKQGADATALLAEVDMIIPATEHYRTLVWLNEMTGRSNIPCSLDLPAYTVSSSKIKSNQLFTDIGIKVPETWPKCGFPVIVKPSQSSGSFGVEKITSLRRLNQAVESLGSEIVIQEYLAGPSYSLEVIANQGKCVGLQVTKLDFDWTYDCKRVLAGPNIGLNIAGAFNDICEKIANELKLSGIMDIEVIDTGEELKVLEIDARLPSQTPSVVYHSTGVNMVELLVNYWVKGQLPNHGLLNKKQAVIYEHLSFKHGILQVKGEHILVDAPDLKIYKNKFSTDILISNFEKSPEDWVATTIYMAKSEYEVWEKRNQAIECFQREFKVSSYLDLSPFDEGSNQIDQVIL